MADTPVYHLRITIDEYKILKEEHRPKQQLYSANKIWNDFKKTFNPEKYLVYFETSDKGIPHIHARIIYDRPPKQTLYDFFSKHHLKGKYHHELEKDKLKNELYIMKDGNMIDTNYNKEEIKELLIKLEKIDKDKKKYIGHKILEKIVLPYDDVVLTNKEYYLCEQSIITQIKKIYVEQWDKLPPTRSLETQLLNYVLIKKKIYRKNI